MPEDFRKATDVLLIEISHVGLAKALKVKKMNLFVMVRCWKGGSLLATYDFVVPGSLAAPAVLNQEKLIAEAKENLTNEGRAFPPYEGITFNIPS